MEVGRLSPWWRLDIDDVTGELSRLWSQAIVLPWRQRRAERRAPVTKAAGSLAGGDGAQSAADGRGTLVLIGGAQIGDEMVLEMIRAAGGRGAHIAILPTASLDFSRGGQRYARCFRRFGASLVETLEIVTRERAQDPAWAARLAKADLIFLGGGDEALFLSILTGTPALAALIGTYRRGAVIAGVGAGAAVMGELAAVGEEGGLRPGLGLLPGTVVDGRPGRLFHAVSRHRCSGWLVGLGLDEDTALIVGPDLTGRVVGQGMALVVNQPPGTPARPAPAGAQPAAPVDVLVHVLPAGTGYDFTHHRPVSMPAAEERNAGADNLSTGAR